MTEELEKTYVKNVYEDIAIHFDVTRQYKWDWVEKFRCNYKDTDLIYDIGCGNGRNMGKNTIGIDNCRSFLDICRNNNLKVKEGCMTLLPLKDKSGDAIQCIATFHHLSNEERRLKGLEEMKRVLKPKSRILLSVWSKKQPKQIKRIFNYGDNYVPWTTTSGEVYRRYYYIFRIDEIKELFEKVNLKVIEHSWSFGNEIFILETP
jgi:SAM-dependent methyltransferase